jgi:hypothetical protein
MTTKAGPLALSIDDTAKNLATMSEIEALIERSRSLTASKGDPEQLKVSTASLCHLQTEYHRLMDDFKSRVEQLDSSEELSALEDLVAQLFEFVASRGYWRYHQPKWTQRYGGKADFRTQAVIHDSTCHIIRYAATMFGESLCKRIAATYVQKIARMRVRQWVLQHIIGDHQGIIAAICRLNSGRLPVQQFVKIWQQMPPKLALLRAQLEYRRYLKQCKKHGSRDHNRVAWQHIRPREISPKRTYIENISPTELLHIIYRSARKLGLLHEQLMAITDSSWGLRDQEAVGRLLRLYLEEPALREQIRELLRERGYDYGWAEYRDPQTAFGDANEYLLATGDVQRVLSTFDDKMLQLAVQQPGAPVEIVIAAERKHPGKLWRHYQDLQTPHIDALQQAFPDRDVIQRGWAVHHMHKRNGERLLQFTDTNWLHVLEHFENYPADILALFVGTRYNGEHIRQQWVVMGLRRLGYNVKYPHHSKYSEYAEKPYVSLDLDTCGDDCWKELRECKMWRTPTANLHLYWSATEDDSPNDRSVKFYRRLADQVKSTGLFESIGEFALPRSDLSPDDLLDVAVLLARALNDQIQSLGIKIHPVVAYWCSARKALRNCNSAIVQHTIPLGELQQILDGDAEQRCLTGNELEAAIREKWLNYIPMLNLLSSTIHAFSNNGVNTERNYMHPYSNYLKMLAAE